MDKESQKIFEALYDLHDRYDEDPKHMICAEAAEQIKKLCEEIDTLKKQKPDEKLSLAMSAGARAIEQSRQYEHGATYIYDVFGKSKEIPYRIAAKVLRETAEAALEKEETNE